MSFLEIFQPGLKHLREERDRQKMLVVRPSHGGGAPMGIDLDAGKATISITPTVAIWSHSALIWLGRQLREGYDTSATGPA